MWRSSPDVDERHIRATPQGLSVVFPDTPSIDRRTRSVPGARHAPHVACVPLFVAKQTDHVLEADAGQIQRIDGTAATAPTFA